MFSSMFPLLYGAFYIFYQVFASEFNIAELLLESNVSLDTSRVMAALNFTTLPLTYHMNSSSVTLESIELVAECELVGDDTVCNCSAGYVWSDEVCYSYDCCRAGICTKNVSFASPICVPSVAVTFSGSLVIDENWSEELQGKVESEFEKLNALQQFQISGSGTTAEFSATVGVTPNLAKFEEIMKSLDSSVQKEVQVQVEGLVQMKVETGPVCYHSDQELSCDLAMATEKSSWKLGRPTGDVELSDGTVVEVKRPCATSDDNSCIQLGLKKVTSIWTGNYTCEFQNGSITYKATAFLQVAELPDDISMSVSPLVVDCSVGEADSEVTVDVAVTIPLTTASYQVQYSSNGAKSNSLTTNRTKEDRVEYSFRVPIPCKETDESQYVEITFKNIKNQNQTSRLDVTVLYASSRFCEEETVDSVVWPKTPFKATVVNKECPEGRTGFKTRTCDGPQWMDVFNSCVNKKLNGILHEAEKFRKGQGPTSDIAKTIFQNVTNTSAFTDESDSTTADVDVSIKILDSMSLASGVTVLQEDVLPVMIEAASQILNTTWTGVNDTVRSGMSANYMEAMERLVENINTNRTNALTTQNVELKICPIDDCNVTVFGVEVSVNRSAGRPKVMAVKNLTPKVKNTYPNTEQTDYIMSATVGLDHNENGTKQNRTSPVEIFMDFPILEGNTKKAICVFWNLSTRSWSDEGCVLISDRNGSLCHCNHLTSFSVLMAKSDVSNPALSILTKVGLSVSICSLLIFLAIEALVWSAVVKTNLSHFRHTAIVNIATFRLLADCGFLASSIPDELSDDMCLALTVAKHLFYTAMFCWMLCMSVMLVHQLIFVFSPLRKRVFMLLSSAVGYLVPILIVGSSYVYYRYKGQVYHNKDTCWLNYDGLLKGSLYAFLIPVLVIILINIFSLVVVIVTLVKTQTPDCGKADNNKDTAKSIIKVLVVLAPVFGATWVIGFLVNVVDQDSPVFIVIVYAFDILNSFQGLFILFAGCFAEQKVREEALRIITGKGKSDASKSLTSTTYTKDK